MTKQNKKNNRSRFVVTVKRTLQALATDLDQTQQGSAAARTLLDALEPLRNDQILPALRDHDSALYKAIPVDLMTSEGGKAYLDVLSTVTTFSQQPQNTNDDELAQFPPLIRDMARQLQTELGLSEDTRVEDIDIVSLLKRAVTVVDGKIQRGEIDKDELVQSSSNVMSKVLARPEMAAAIQQLAPDMEKIISDAAVTSTTTP